MYKINKYQTPEEENDFAIPRNIESLPNEFHPNIYKILPKTLSNACDLFKNPKEKDIILLGSLSVISSCLSNICGIYDMKTVYPNFFVFITAPAGSGKGILQWTRKYAEKIHQDMLKNSTKAYNTYKSELKTYHTALKKKNISTNIEPPIEPSRKMLIIPANNSASSFLQTLSDNDGTGLLFSTEADTLANSLSQDWGNYSDMLRCAFQHEPISLQRKTNREFLELTEPKLSVLLTGTKDQLYKLIPSTENGLFSRFAYYSFPAVTFFKDVFIDMEHSTLNEFNKLGELIFEFRNSLMSMNNTVEWQFSNSIKTDFKDSMNELMQQLHKVIGNQCLATIKRLGLILFRISMISSTLRVLEQGKKLQSKMTIESIDYKLAYEIVVVLLHHALILIAETKTGNQNIIKQKRMMQLFNLLPENFTRKEAITFAEQLKLSTATCDRFLNSDAFKKISYGNYKKSNA